MTRPRSRLAAWSAATVAVLALGLAGCSDDGSDSGSGSGSGSGSSSGSGSGSGSASQ
jgi:hypothetical protein